MKKHKKIIKRTAWMLLFVLSAELIQPATALALTTGPTQPEVLSFEPVGTTDMVDMFSGDFVYNIPLLDVEGYPVNIAYHGGVNMEQEASWVGLGWNINPGEINRSVRGLPDDFNGDTLYKRMHINPEKTIRIGIGAGIEFFGKGDPNPPKKKKTSLDLGLFITTNNYRGVSADINLGVGINFCKWVSAGVNIGVGSQSGAELSYNASFKTSEFIQKDQIGIGLGVNQGYSSRTGLSNMHLSVFAFGSNKVESEKQTKQQKVYGPRSASLEIFAGNIPIGLQNYVPVITNSSTMYSYEGRIKVGLEYFWNLGYAKANGMYSEITYGENGSRPGYGYLYMQNASTIDNACQGIMDFTRDKDGIFNKTMPYLPMANMTYDVYSVSGQGTGGMFRPFRNDYGSVFDPQISSDAKSYSLGLEAGIPHWFELGGDYTNTKTAIKSGIWSDYFRKFAKNRSGSVYENVYLRQGGELVTVDTEYMRQIDGTTPRDPSAGIMHFGLEKINSTGKRDVRGNLIYYFTAEEAQSGIGSDPNIINYTSTDGFSSGSVTSTETISRTSSTALGRKKDQISEVVQLQKDGRRYIYGLPAMNNVQKEATFSVDGSGYSSNGLCAVGGNDNLGNTKGADNYYSETITPSYAHSYLLTSVLSTDYVDITGNGLSDDDLGSYTKLNYSLKEKDYRWRAPYSEGQAQYNPGFRSDKRDDKGSYMIGSREEWMLHSIETRNFIAEFYTSERNDACGSADPIASSGKYAIAPYNSGSSHAPSYKLDSIKLFNKHDRFINGTSAVPVKSVFFLYTDTLCTGIPNTISGSGGKLTLSKIYFRYGNSQKSMISPYQFGYGFNPNYDLTAKDRWGNYKAPQPGNYEYPFVEQRDPDNDLYASAWSLTKIGLPSGGVIEARYESDDYGYVQDRQADEMFKIEGIGNTKEYDSSNLLYIDKHSYNLYFYFRRRTNAEHITGTVDTNYITKSSLLYYNFSVKMRADKDLYEQIKGYSPIDTFGYCHDGIHGYIKVKPVDPVGSQEVRLNPVSFTAITTGRYNLPQIMYPGSEPDWDILHALGHMFGNFSELGSLFQNPTIHFLNKKAAQRVALSNSFIRLKSPGLHKKGGGQRVRSLLFYDSWNKLSGGNEQNAKYGKSYNYTLPDGSSSGVASYEPFVGGDENPFREPVPYHAADGRRWPPMDPVDMYQELPLGETLYPPASVGYSKVTTSSIHADVGRSSQGKEVYTFYTAKDFPIYAESTQLIPSHDNKFNVFFQENVMEARQGFTLVMNDMHGKPKSVEHYIKKLTGELIKVSSQSYIYKGSDKRLDNHVKCIVYNRATGDIRCKKQQIGVDADVTLDTREKDEQTKKNTFNMNLNISGIFPLIIPIPYFFPWDGSYHNCFRSATMTKVIQQYGILDRVETYNEGANIRQQNEVFDPETGQVVISSVTTEYSTGPDNNKEYTTTIPAYWAYSGMAPAYSNIKYEGDIGRVKIDGMHVGRFFWPDANLKVGDELIISYIDSTGGGQYTNRVWFTDGKFVPEAIVPYPHYDSIKMTFCYDCAIDVPDHCEGSLLPRYPLNTSGWDAAHVLKNVHFKVIRSGGRNMLTSSIERYTQTDDPVSGGILQLYSDHRINSSVSTFCDSNTVVPYNYLANADSINPFVIGQRGIYRLLSEYAYATPRNTPSPGEKGIYSASNFYSFNSYDNCVHFPYNYMLPNNVGDGNWKLMRTITKWSPFGLEIENRDATGVYSSAVFGYNEDLPVAVAANAKQGQVIAESFEDYNLLNMIHNLVGFNFSFVRPLFSTTALGSSTQYNLLALTTGNGLSVTTAAAHTGLNSLYCPGSGYFEIGVPVDTNTYAGFRSMFNTYFDPTSYVLNGKNEYAPFRVVPNKKYIASFWIRAEDQSGDPTDYSLDGSCGMNTDLASYGIIKRSNIIDGWQQVEVAFMCSTSAALRLPAPYYIDDLRIFPADANVKSFVYNPVNEKLMATLDENNFAKMFEYDQEGNLVRVKKETEKGIMTVSESRSNNPAN